jgi:Leucine-rich repeat (LRR) protein
MGDEGAKSLAKSTNFPNLTHLYVGQNIISDAGAVALVQSENFPKLVLLDMIQNKLGEKTLKAMFKYNKDQRVEIVVR